MNGYAGPIVGVSGAAVTGAPDDWGSVVGDGFAIGVTAATAVTARDRSDMVALGAFLGATAAEGVQGDERHRCGHRRPGPVGGRHGRPAHKPGTRTDLVVQP